MLGQREATAIQSSIDDARVVFERNSCQLFLAKCDQLTGRVKIFQQDFKAGKLVLESCNLRLAQAGCTQGAVCIVGVCLCAFVCMLLSRRGREEFDDEIGMRILPVALMSSFSALSSLSPQALIRWRHGGFSL
jgi:hypothetical protein